VKYVALDDINQLWGCYLTNKIDPSVFDEPCQAADMATEAAEVTKLNKRLNLFTWKPTVFVDAINHETTRNKNGHLIKPFGAASQKTANSYLKHITNFILYRTLAKYATRPPPWVPKCHANNPS